MISILRSTRVLVLLSAVFAMSSAAAREWVVDAAAAAPGSGSQAAPFATLAGAQQASRAKDVIILRAGVYREGIQLKDGQTLRGVKNAVVSDQVVLASGATVSGITIRVATRAAIRGNAVRDVTVSDVAVELSGDAQGIVLTNAGGTIAAGGSVQGTGSGAALQLDAGDAAYAFRGLTIEQAKGSAIEIRNLAGGSVTFDDASSATTTAAASDAVVVISNRAAVVLPRLHIATAGAVAFLVRDCASVALRGGTSSLEAKGARAVLIEDSGIDIDVRSISADGGTEGVVLARLAGPFRVSGEGTAAGSGGTIRNTRNRGVAVANASGITLRNLTLDHAVTENGKCGVPPSEADARQCNAAVHLADVENVVLEGVQIHDSEQFGINAHAVRNLTLSHVDLHNAGDESLESGIFVRNISGELKILDSTVRDNAARQLDLAVTTGELAVELRNATFDGSEPPLGQQGVALSAGGDARVRLAVDQTTIVGNFSNALHVTGSGKAQIDARIEKNIFRDNASAVLLTPTDHATLTYRIAGNTITGSRSTALTIHSTGSAKAKGEIVENTIGVQGKANSGASCDGGGCGAIAVRSLGSGTSFATIAGNTVQQVESGVSIQASDRVDARVRVTGNIIREPAGNHPRPAVSVVTGIRDKDLSALCVELSENEISGAWNGGGPAIHIVRRFPNSSLALAGYAGDPAAAANAAKFIAGRNRGAAVAADVNGELTLADACPLPRENER